MDKYRGVFVLGQWFTSEFKRELSSAEIEFCENVYKRVPEFKITYTLNLFRDTDFLAKIYKKRPIIGVLIEECKLVNQSGDVLFVEYFYRVKYANIRNEDIIDFTSSPFASFDFNSFFDAYSLNYKTYPQNLYFVVYDVDAFYDEFKNKNTPLVIMLRYPLFIDYNITSFSHTIGGSKYCSQIVLEISTYMPPSKYQSLMDKSSVHQDSVINMLNIYHPEIPDFVKAWVLFSFLQQSVTYHTTLAKKIENKKDLHPTEAESLTIYGALCNNKAISIGIAEAYEWLLDKVKIPSVKIRGTLDAEDAEDPYFFNSVWLGNEGKVYFVDCSYGIEARGKVDPTAFLDFAGDKYKFYTAFNNEEHYNYSCDISFDDVWSYVNSYKETLIAYGIPEKYLLPSLV